MKVEQLRIGNYVHPCTDANPAIIPMNNFLARIFTLEYDGAKLALDHKKSYAEQECHLYRYNRISPIPLTEEWLLKFGGNADVNNKNWFYIPNFYEVFFEDDLWKLYCEGYTLAKFQYVHQLQNLHFALTGKELISI